MKRSAYIEWAKQRAALRYTLARSGVPLCSASELGADSSDLVLHSADEDGWHPLKAAVGERYGVPADRVALTHGATMANHLAMTLLSEAGDEVLVERPGYEPLLSLVELLGRRPTHFDRPHADGAPRLAEAVEAGLTDLTRLVVVTHPHNPTGRVCPSEEFEELASLAGDRGFRVLVDEIYLDLVPGGPHPTMATVSDSFTATGSLTKSFGLGALRIGWILASSRAAVEAIRLNDLFSLVIAHPSERLGFKALQRAEQILRPRLDLLARNLEAVDRFIVSRPDLEWARPDAGTVGWVGLEGVDPEALCRLLETEYESAVAPGAFFGDPGRFRIGFGMPAGDLDEALRRLGEALDRLAPA